MDTLTILGKEATGFAKFIKDVYGDSERFKEFNPALYEASEMYFKSVCNLAEKHNLIS